jgi:FkbM family methyltransferase
MTLDSVARETQLDRIDLLWVDIQGAERDMIAGGRHALSRTRYMMIEAEPEV